MEREVENEGEQEEKKVINKKIAFCSSFSPAFQYKKEKREEQVAAIEHNCQSVFAQKIFLLHLRRLLQKLTHTDKNILIYVLLD